MTTLVVPSPSKVFPPRPSEFLLAWFSRCPREQLLELRALRDLKGLLAQGGRS